MNNKLKLNKQALMLLLAGSISIVGSGCSKKNEDYNDLNNNVKAVSFVPTFDDFNNNNDKLTGADLYKILISNGKKEKIGVDLETVKNLETTSYEAPIGPKVELNLFDEKKPAYTVKNVAMKKNYTKDSKKVLKIPKYNKINVLGNYCDWFLVKYNGKKGYIKSKNFEELNGDYVEVDITKQTMKYFNKDNKLKIKSAVVTGLDSDPERSTPTGLYDIYLKELDRDLIGRNPDGSEKYRSHVSYWMPFTGGYGLHDATWRSVFGGDIYKYSGSHGCVNLPLDVAKKLYSKTEVGTKVLIYKSKEN